MVVVVVVVVVDSRRVSLDGDEQEGKDWFVLGQSRRVQGVLHPGLLLTRLSVRTIVGVEFWEKK